jgi:uncharacterized iron-regulated membrane protein
MFGHLQDPRNHSRPLMAGIALLILSGVCLAVPLGPLVLALSGVCALLGLASLGIWWKRKRESRYDLRRLWDEPVPEPEEPRYDTVPEGEAAAPYCAWCDEAYPPDTYRCGRCGRQLT